MMKLYSNFVLEVYFLLLISIFCIGCQVKTDTASEQPSIQKIITLLKSDKPEEYEAGIEYLQAKRELGLTIEEGIIALRAASHKYPPRKYDF
jgi:hypothetical protein